MYRVFLGVLGNSDKNTFMSVFRFGLWMVFFHDFPENDPFITGAIGHRVIVRNQQIDID